jgi:hypothetical protein
MTGFVHRYVVHRCSSPEGLRVAPADDGRCTRFADTTWLVETMLKLHGRTADGLRLSLRPALLAA